MDGQFSVGSVQTLPTPKCPTERNTDMEKMTNKERETLLALQAKAKRVQRAEEEFFRDVDERKDEILERWNTSDRLQALASQLGTDADSLFDWILSDEHAYLYRKHLSQTDPANGPYDPE